MERNKKLIKLSEYKTARAESVSSSKLGAVIIIIIVIVVQRRLIGWTPAPAHDQVARTLHYNIRLDWPRHRSDPLSVGSVWSSRTVYLALANGTTSGTGWPV